MKKLSQEFWWSIAFVGFLLLLFGLFLGGWSGHAQGKPPALPTAGTAEEIPQKGTAPLIITQTDATTIAIVQINGPSGMMVRIEADGKVTYGKNYTPDAAAKIFWEAIATKYPCPHVLPAEKKP